jgi:hypothetical protein
MARDARRSSLVFQDGVADLIGRCPNRREWIGS